MKYLIVEENANWIQYILGRRSCLHGREINNNRTGSGERGEGLGNTKIKEGETSKYLILK